MSSTAPEPGRETITRRLDEHMQATYGFVLGTADRDVLVDAALAVIAQMTADEAINPLNRLADDLDHVRRFNDGEFGTIVTPEWLKHSARALSSQLAWQRPDPLVPELRHGPGFTADTSTVASLRHLASVYPLTGEQPSSPESERS